VRPKKGRGTAGSHRLDVMTLALRKANSSAFLAALLVFVQGAALAQSVPAAIFTDPAPDKAHPAKMTVVHIPTHGLLISGLVYQASGAGLHPTIVICHGLPGNEKNLDLAQATPRAGWNAVTFNYRGSWGSPGNFRFAQNPKTPRRSSTICARRPTLPLWVSTRAGSSSRAIAWAVG